MRLASAVARHQGAERNGSRHYQSRMFREPLNKPLVMRHKGSEKSNEHTGYLPPRATLVRMATRPCVRPLPERTREAGQPNEGASSPTPPLLPAGLPERA